MKKIFVEAVMLLFAHAGFTQTNTDKAPLIIREQGCFLAGGTVIKGEGTYDHLDICIFQYHRFNLYLLVPSWLHFSYLEFSIGLFSFHISWSILMADSPYLVVQLLA